MARLLALAVRTGKGVALKILRFSPGAVCRKALKHYVTDQLSFIRKRGSPPARIALQLYALPANYVVSVPPTSRHMLQRAADVDVISERQYVLSERTLYSYYDRSRPFRRIGHYFPALVLYRVEVSRVFGSLGFAHGIYYHIIVEYFFQVYLLIQRKLNDMPVLWRDMPTGISARLIEMFERAGVSFVIVPSRSIYCTLMSSIVSRRT